MSSGELLLTLLVALIVFGPSKMPMLASHLGSALRKIKQYKSHVELLWQQQLAQLQLQEKEQKAKRADEQYKS